MITRDLVLEYFDYNKDTGELVWKKSSGQRSRTGEAVGSIESRGYLTVGLFGKRYKVHRIIWIHQYGYEPIQIDHINQIKTDNRLNNLREVTHDVNHKNRPIQINNSSGYSGVHKKKNRWIARIKVNQDRKYLGSFETFEDAVIAKKEAEVKYGFHKNHGKRK